MAARQFGITLQNALGGMDPAFSQQIVAPQPEPKQGLSKGQLIAGIIGDMLAQVGGGKAVFAPMMAQQREQEQEDVRWSRRQQAENDQWMRRQEYERAHPAPHYWETNNGSLATLGANGPEIIYKDPTPKYVPDGVGGLVAVPGTGVPAATGPAPGVTFTPIPDGGPTQPASGGFRKPYYYR